MSFRLWLFKPSSTRAWDSPALLARHDTPFAGDETVRGGPVEHLAGTRARTVLRVRRNVLGVLPILSSTRADCGVVARQPESSEAMVAFANHRLRIPLLHGHRQTIALKDRAVRTDRSPDDIEPHTIHERRTALDFEMEGAGSAS